MVSQKEYISRDISNLITKYLICKKTSCKKLGKIKVNPDQWNMDTHKGYYCTKCEQRISIDRQWVGGSGPGRSFFFQGC